MSLITCPSSLYIKEVMTKCNHSYITDHFKRLRAIGNECPYPEFYEKARSAVSGAHEPDSAPPTLPIDDVGACIFHSHEVAWKRKNSFKERFLQLLQLLDADGAVKNYDFAEFVFVGGEPIAQDGSEESVLHIADTTFGRQAYFTGATFLDSFALDRVEFQGGADFEYAKFANDLRIENTRIHGANFNRATLARVAAFTKVEFLDYALFGKTTFTGTETGYAVKFEESRFEGITDFSGAVFALGDQSTAGFLNVKFEDFTDFKGAQFDCQVEFSDVLFAFTTDFIDTSFNTTRSSARYRGSAVEFNRISVTAGAVLTFMSTDPQNKMFDLDVQMSFNEDPAGTIRFENVHFSRISTDSKGRLTHLAKLGRVEIGTGCIKYRFQTGIRTISVTQGNAPLIVEICQTFTNYFTASSGLNLGFEIVERDKAKVSFFYFTDEDISEAAFLDRLAQTEKSLWDLLFLRPDEEQRRIEQPASAGKGHSLINAVDGLSALLGTFFRVGVRIALGAWKESDTKALWGTIQFNDEGAEDRAASLHRVLVDKYTDTALFSFNHQQNAILPPMVVKGRNLLTPTKVRILFLAANSELWPLDLEREVNKIQTSLRLAKERDNLEIRQEWVVTVDTLMQAMLDVSPTIVHFSGLGEESGIILRDDFGEPKIVSPDALSSLFKLFKDTVRCVVLNSCYSEPQARAIRRHIPYVIGTRCKIPDPVAVAFSAGFYKALGAGKDIPFAFDMGKMSVQMEGVSGENILTLL